MLDRATVVAVEVEDVGARVEPDVKLDVLPALEGLVEEPTEGALAPLVGRPDDGEEDAAGAEAAVRDSLQTCVATGGP
jgi:hypothetical protein